MLSVEWSVRQQADGKFWNNETILSRKTAKSCEDNPELLTLACNGMAYSRYELIWDKKMSLLRSN